ncbi:MAG: SH3 domain-containing protein, partial [Anaerolineae bacterium]|nr:SH3 domain-containing protein [Anaerolineae bacterium]
MKARARMLVLAVIWAVTATVTPLLWPAPSAALPPSLSGPSPSPTATATPGVTPTTTPTRSTPAAVDICEPCRLPMATALLNLNIRRGPGVAYPILGALRTGQSAEISGISVEGDWLQIAYARAPQGVGWVSRRYVFVSGDLSSVPVVAAPPPPIPSPTPTATSTATPPAPETLTSWRGEYYDNLYLQGPPVLVRDDAEIDFNWADRAPAPG